MLPEGKKNQNKTSKQTNKTTQNKILKECPCGGREVWRQAGDLAIPTPICFGFMLGNKQHCPRQMRGEQNQDQPTALGKCNNRVGMNFVSSKFW